MNNADSQAPAFTGQALAGFISPADFAAASQAAADRHVALAHILHYEYNIPRHVMLQALAAYYKCQSPSGIAAGAPGESKCAPEVVSDN